MPGPKPVPIEVTDAQMRALQAIVNKRDEPHILVVRAWIIVLAHLGHATRSIARSLHVSEDCVTHWKQRWREQARTGVGETNLRLWLTDAPRSGHPPSISAEEWCQIMALACSDPTQSQRPLSHWTHRELLDEILKRQIVSSLSESHLARFFKRSRSQAPSQPLLAHSPAGSAAGHDDPSGL